MYNQNCGCGSTPYNNYYPTSIANCDPCNTTGCPVQLDFDCVIYHKANNQIAALPNLSLSNGATLQLFAEAVDVKLGQLNFPVFSLPFLRSSFSINTLRQFAESVDLTLSSLRADLTTVAASASVPITTIQTNSVELTASGNVYHTLQADVNISASANNQVSVLSDGLYASPQTLTVNYTNKELSISGGNTVSLASLICGVGGFLGNQTTDPSAIDGQYWFNTTTNQLKIRVNGLVKVITLT